MHAVALRRRQLERADAFDGHFAALALHVGNETKPVSSVNEPPSCGRSRLTRN